MKIITYEVPCTVKKKGEGAYIEYDEKAKVIIKEEPIELRAHEIPKKSSEIGRENDEEVLLAKSMAEDEPFKTSVKRKIIAE